ncbi:MAG TPA: carboxypeptidase-like regulatory domain-containing protein, partial [Thermoanaerobaculia bacterium]|nr:carboxypeptidase-like regulatory domain-containing protein [Thermoanaerobaculia bacterium]
MGLALAALTVLTALSPRDATAAPASAPISGIVRAGGRAVAGATLLVETMGARRVLKTAADGSFVLAGALPGLYTITSLTPGFRPAIAKILHRTQNDLVSFVSLDLVRDGTFLPRSDLGDGDPWVARALVAGDPLRDLEPVQLADLEEPRSSGSSAFRSNVAALDLPRNVHASVETMTGFGDATLSRTSLDLSGVVAGSVKFGVEGQYSRLSADGGSFGGDASRFALDVAPASEQSIRLSSRRQTLPRSESEEDASRFAAHAVDWNGATGDTSRASVSARLVSQSNLDDVLPAAEALTRATNAFEVLGRYRTGVGEDHFVRLLVGYRAATGPASVPGALGERQTRVGGSAGGHVLGPLVVEAGAVGDFSTLARGLTPELTLAIEPGNGWRLYGYVARRWEKRLLDERTPGLVGIDDADIASLTRSTYRGGLRFQGSDGAELTVEAARRELNGTYRLLLSPDFVDRLDSLYFFPNDVATEISAAATFRVAKGLDGRIEGRIGSVVGERDGSINSDEG